MTGSPALDPATRLVRSLDGEYFMLREAAEILSVSHRTLRRLLDDEPEKLGPSFCTYFGKVKIYLYTIDDIDKLKVHLNRKKKIYKNTDTPKMTGRPTKWTNEERIARQRLYSSRHYYDKQAQKLRDRGDTDAARIAQAKVDLIEKELKANARP